MLLELLGHCGERAVQRVLETEPGVEVGGGGLPGDLVVVTDEADREGDGDG